jgi:photosystem II stability/assembly factor-like uncharacterized protein
VEPLEQRGPGPRARRALPIIAVALVTMLVAALLYLRPALPSSGPAQSQLQGAFTVDPGYQVAYYFVSATAGWAALARIESTDVAYWVFATTDGAHHWKVQTAGSVAGPVASVQLRFFDRSHGYAQVGGQAVLATADGGATWRRVPLPLGFAVEVTFSDPRHGWLEAGGDLQGGKGHYPFYATLDGGITWSQLPDPPGDGFVFRNPSEGWAAAITSSGAIGYSTYDGGVTWTPHSLPEAEAPNATGVFESAGARLLPGRGVMITTGNAAFTSLDGGATWRAVFAPPGALFFDMAFQDATHWWAMPSGNLFKTSDAGRSWKHVSLQFDDWQYRVQVIDAQRAWAQLGLSIGTQDPIRGTSLAYTSDGGVHWSYAGVPKTPL